VIVVDDGSSDDTLQVANSVYGHLPHVLFVQQPENRGKGPPCGSASRSLARRS